MSFDIYMEQMTRGPYDPYLKDAIGERLRLTRVALGYRSQAEFVRMLGTPDITPQHWNNWEAGRARISMDSALTVIKRVKSADGLSVTLDWLFRGEKDGLSSPLARAIDQLEALQARKVALHDRQ